MKCPKCNQEQSDTHTECVRCGIIFEKYHQLKAKQKDSDSAIIEGAEAESFWPFVRELIFYVKPETDVMTFAFRVIFFLVIFIWGLRFIIAPMESNIVGQSFWHLVNLPFHEAGHIFFRPLGRFMTSLGGSLTQLLMPLICLVVLLVKTRDAFGASFSLWWLGENFMDLAPYINDARSLTMPLLGGNTGRTSPYGFHDWEFILKESGLIRYYHTIANASHYLGILLMITAFFWGGYLLYQQYQRISRS
jgi:hypothetical protein